ncbi:hypothetical protein METUNv1_03729 [Methyloversatilis universalis FAM5]|uniref:Uncharacterized protein n=1 Tax=Methyloversatilis universalis (strain ATCC BAA-1314 / DSM 25237 / JCM 13912 / CCUG 52030 / FAM5) TaxID=1000565 RepID=F5RHD2_METUF|nr:virulence factor TspB C-terminal domain-related protein [Methyloversatilis universalis]EGK69764.1 hypothetical protein METUNv1_03729 [Methyloversatilis universalis FAM5]
MDHLPLLSARRAVRALAAFLVGVFAASFSLLALANPSAPLNQVVTYAGGYGLRVPSSTHGCSGSAPPSPWQLMSYYQDSSLPCGFSAWWVHGACDAGTVMNTTTRQCATPPPPECASGQVRNTVTGVCQPPCAAAGTAGGSNYVSPYTIAPTAICRDGCKLTVGEGFTMPWSNGSTLYGVRGLVHTSQFCSGDLNGSGPGNGETESHDSPSDPDPIPVTPPDDPPRCPTGKCPGYFNGSYMCVACSEMASENKPITTYNRTTETTTTGTPPNQTTSTTTTDTRATHNGTGTVTSTTSTTTTTTGPNGTTTSTESKETKEPKESFCKENPSSAFCKEGRFGGSCGSFTCEGDAVQCAVAREIHQRNCEAVASNVYTDMVDAAQAGSDTGSTYIQGQKDGTPLDVTGKFSSSLDASPIAATCPSPRSVPLPGGNSFEISFEKPCEAAGWLGNFVQAFAYLFAALIVLRNPSA